MAKTPIVQFKTPEGELKWVVVSGEGKANQSGKMKYCADLVMPADAPDAVALMKQMDEFWTENKPGRYPAKTKGYRMETKPKLDAAGEKQYDEEDRVITEETGNVVFPFQTDTTWSQSGDPKIISIFNARGNKVSLGAKKIGNGSRGNVGGAMGIYAVEEKGKITTTGVTLYLNSIRITKLVEFNNEDSWEDAGEGWTGEDNWDAEDAPAEQTPPPRL